MSQACDLCGLPLPPRGRGPIRRRHDECRRAAKYLAAVVREAARYPAIAEAVRRAMFAAANSTAFPVTSRARRDALGRWARGEGSE